MRSALLELTDNRKHEVREAKEFPKFNCFRNSRSHMCFKIGVLKNLAIFTGNEHLCWSLILIKFRPKACNSIIKRLQLRCFPRHVARNFFRAGEVSAN